MPCNTAHYFYDDLAALTDIPFLHMMRIAVHQYVDQFPNSPKIGLIATEGQFTTTFMKTRSTGWDGKSNSEVPRSSRW